MAWSEPAEDAADLAENRSELREDGVVSAHIEELRLEPVAGTEK